MNSTVKVVTISLLAVVSAISNFTSAAEPSTKPAAKVVRHIPVVYCLRADGHQSIDGKFQLSSPENQIADFIRDDHDEPPAYPTVAEAFWDDENIYFNICCDDNMKELKKKQRGSGMAWEEDSVELFITENASRTTYRHFVISASGKTNLSNDLRHGNRNLAGSSDDNQWRIESRIPFQDLAGPPTQINEVWGLNIARNILINGKQQSASWARLKGSYHMVDRFGLMVFRNYMPAVKVNWIDTGPEYEGANIMLVSLTNTRNTAAAVKISASTAKEEKKEFNLALDKKQTLVYGIRYDLQPNNNIAHLSVSGDEELSYLDADLKISARNRPAQIHFDSMGSVELSVANTIVSQPETIAAMLCRRSAGAARDDNSTPAKYRLTLPETYSQATIESADGKFNIPAGADGEAKLIAEISDDKGQPVNLNISLKLAGEILQSMTKRQEQLAARMPEIIAKTKDDPLLSLYCKKTQIKLERLKSFCKDRQLAKASATTDEIAHHVDQLAAGQQPIWGHHELTYRSDIDDSDQPFFVSVPPTYDPQGSDKMPVMLWLHCWWGDAGWTAEDIKAYASAMELACWKKGVILVHPFGRGSNFYQFDAMKDVDDVMAFVEKKWRIDPDRIYVAGFSMGGYGALQLASARPEKFAAMAAFSYAVDSLSPENPAKITSLFSLPLENLFRTPVYLSCGAQEKVCAQMAKMADLIKKFSARTVDTKFFAAPNEGHSEDYIDFTSLLDWMLNLRRMPPPAVFSYTADDLIFNRGFWCSIDGLTNFAKPGKVSVSLANNKLTIETTGVASLSLTPPATLYDNSKPLEIFLNQTRINVAPDNNGVIRIAASPTSSPTTTPVLPPKRPGLSGPMGLAIASGPIVLIACDDDSQQAAQSVAAEWQKWHHGKMSVVRQADVTDADLAGKNLILVGNWNSDGLMAKMRQAASAVKITNKGVWISERKINFGGVGVAFIHPSPVDPTKLALVLTGVNTKTVAGAAEIFQRRRFDTDFYSGIEGGFFDVNWK